MLRPLLESALRHLRYFVTVAAERSFTRAAQHLHVVQSAVSAGVRTLEKELGAELFDRSAQRVALTGAGQALLPRAVATLDAAQEARDAVLATQGRIHGTLRIGGMTANGPLDIPALLGRYHELHPDVDLSLQMSPAGSAGHLQRLLTGDLDAAFVSPIGRLPAGLEARQLASARMILVVPADHRLAERSAFALHELINEPFIDSPVGYGNRDLIDRAFSATGASRRVTLEAADLGTTLAFVRRGLGIALLPEFLLAPGREELGVLFPQGESLVLPYSLATATSRHPTAPLQALVSLVDEEEGCFVDRSGA
ncbi:LysR family transcriptional regulator [Streptomyces kronopolitis]|uniref:LysR family transcriptional regulator n=1 Tax=Streptomyces kronopolitis TaxID=1612435 RepID=UPI003430A5D1